MCAEKRPGPRRDEIRTLLGRDRRAALATEASLPDRHRVDRRALHQPLCDWASSEVFGFTTSQLPDELAIDPPKDIPASPSPQSVLTDDDVLAAYRFLDEFLSMAPLTATLTDLEANLVDADRGRAASVSANSGSTTNLIDSALVVRERVGILDTLIHAAVITHVIPLILEEDEGVMKRPSLGAGNDPERVFDLETTARVGRVQTRILEGRGRREATQSLC